MRRLIPFFAFAAASLPVAHAETITDFSLTTSVANTPATFNFSLSSLSLPIITTSPIGHGVRRVYSDIIVNGDPTHPYTVEVDSIQFTPYILILTNPANGYPTSERVFITNPFIGNDEFSADTLPTFTPGSYSGIGAIVSGDPFDLPDTPPDTIPLDSVALSVSQYPITDPPLPPTPVPTPAPVTSDPVPTAVTPEPASLALLGTGLAGLGTILRRRSR